MSEETITLERGVHVFFEPEPESGTWPATMTYSHYLGVLTNVGAPVRTGLGLRTQGDALPCNTDQWARFISGKPAVWTENLQLVYPRAFFAEWSGPLQILGGTKVLFQVRNNRVGDLAELGAGRLIRCDNGTQREIVAVTWPAEYGGMTWPSDYYVLELDTLAGIVNNYAGVNDAKGFYQERAWWERFLQDVIGDGMVGRLKQVWADYDVQNNALTELDQPWEYEVLLSNPQVNEPYGALPGFGYVVQVQKTPLISTSEGSMNYDDFNLTASDKTYKDAIVLTWTACDNATRYQIYVGTTPTFNEAWLVEQQTLDASDVWSDPDQTAGLLAEVPAANWRVSGKLYFTACGLVHGAPTNFGEHDNAKKEPGGSADGTTSGKSCYPATGEEVTDVLTAESQYWYWIRARVGPNGDDEWTELTDETEGVQGTTSLEIVN